MNPILELLLNFSEKIQPSLDLNQGPSAYRADALTTALLGRCCVYFTSHHLYKTNMEGSAIILQHNPQYALVNSLYSHGMNPDWDNFFREICDFLL